jgi:drug/metabolite transporter (DMT)-like permease
VKRDRALAYAAFAVVCIVWGTTYLAIRIAVRTIPPFLLTGIRFTIAGVVLLILARSRGERIPRSRGVLAEVALVGLLLIGLGNFAVAWSEQWVPSGIAALLVATAPFWAALLERVRPGGERLVVRRTIGMLIGFVGVAMLVTPRGAGGAFDAHFMIGAIAVQIGCLSWQYGTVRSKYNLTSVPPLMSSALQMLCGGIVLLFFGLVSGETSNFTATPEGLAALAYLTIFGSILAYTSYVYAVTKIRTTNMALYAYINPLVAVILGWLILDERLTWVSVAAICVILGGVALVQTGGRGHKTVPAAVAGESAA